MKRLLVISSMALTMVVLASCYMPSPTASVGDSNPGGVVAQATLTKFAQQMTETNLHIPGHRSPSYARWLHRLLRICPLRQFPTATVTSVPVITVVPITAVPQQRPVSLVVWHVSVLQLERPITRSKKPSQQTQPNVTLYG